MNSAAKRPKLSNSDVTQSAAIADVESVLVKQESGAVVKVESDIIDDDKFDIANPPLDKAQQQSPLPTTSKAEGADSSVAGSSKEPTKQTGDLIRHEKSVRGGLTDEEMNCVIESISSLKPQWNNTVIARRGNNKSKCFFKLNHVWQTLPEPMRKRFKKGKSGGGPTIHFFEAVKKHPETFVTVDKESYSRKNAAEYGITR